MKKLLLLTLVLLMIPVVMGFTYPYDELLNDWTQPGQTPQNTFHAYTGSSSQIFNFSRTHTSGSYSIVNNMILGDFNDDSSNYEYIFSQGTTIYVVNESLLTKDTQSAGKSTMVTVSPENCGGTAKDKIMYLTSTGITSKCLDSSLTLQAEDSKSFTPRSYADAIKCSDSNYDYGCFVASASGYVFCDITSTSLGVCTEYGNSDIADYSNEQIPAIFDIDGDGDLDAVFYTQNGSDQVGWILVDENGNILFQDNFLLGDNRTTSTKYDKHLPPQIFDSSYIGVIDRTGTNIWTWKIYSQGGALQFTPSPFCSSGSTEQSYPSNIVERDSDDDGFIDEQCFFNICKTNNAGTLSSATQILCNNQYTGNETREGAVESCGGTGGYTCCVDIRGTDLITTEYYPTKTGDELFSSTGVIFYTESAVTDFEYVGTKHGIGLGNFTNPVNPVCGGTDFCSAIGVDNFNCDSSQNAILTDTTGNAFPDIIYYGTSGISYYETAESPGDFNASNNQPTFFTMNTTPNHNVSNLSQDFTVTITGLDTEADTMEVCYDDDYLEGDEGSYTLDNSPKVNTTCTVGLVNYQVNNLLLNSGTRIGTHWKGYIGDTLHRNLSQLDTREGNVVWDTGNVSEFCIYSQEDGTVNQVEGIKVAIHDYYRSGEERIWDYSDSDGEATFSLPNDTYYDVYYYDVDGVFPHYYNGSINCSHTHAPETCNFCSLDLVRITSESSQLSFAVRDSTTFYQIEGANVTLVSPESASKLTAVTGLASFEGLNFTLYEVRFTKSGYITDTTYYDTRSETYTVSLVPENTTQTVIHLTIQDQDTLTVIEQALVQLRNPITYEVYYEFTTSEGTVTQSVFDGNYNWNVYAIQDGYDDLDTSVWVQRDQTNNYILYMNPTGGTIGGGAEDNLTTDRGCQDMISGIWLCDVKFNTCNVDADCLSDECTASGSCSSFNWTYCDQNSRPRNNRCVMSASFNGFMSGAADWMLDNFFWMLVMIVMLLGLVSVLMMVRSRIKS